MSVSAENATLLAKGATADVYAWGEGRVLKLFTERTPWHTNEVSATRAAQEAGLPVPALIDGLIEVGQREGIVFERVDGPTMTEYLQDQPDQVEDCARQAAELQVRIHSTEVTELPPFIEILNWAIEQADPLEDVTRHAVLDLLDGLPGGESLCHNDFYPNNIIVSPMGRWSLTGQSELAAILWQTMRALGSYRGCGWTAWKWEPLNRSGSCGGGSGVHTCSDMASCDPSARKRYCPGRL